MTNYNEFLKLYNKIPKDRMNKVWFICLRPYKKNPIEGSWMRSEAHLTKERVKQAMMNGFNIGIVALPGGVMILDIDTSEKKNILASPELIAKLDAINTFTVRTRSAGLHYYFLNEGLHQTQDIHENGINIGEIRSNISYVLAPGCCVNTNEEKYVVINEAEIKPFPNELLDVKVSNPTEMKLPTLKGKVGRPISEKHKKMIEMFNKKRNKND